MTHPDISPSQHPGAHPIKLKVFLRLFKRMRTTTHSTSPPSSPSDDIMSSIPAPQTRRRTGSFPSLAFSDAMDIPLKATPSPPSTSSSASDISLSPTSSGGSSPIADTTFASLSHPDWPKGDTLSPVSSPSARYTSSASTSSSISGSQASCYISDEDLLDLAQLPLYNDIRVPEHFAVYGYGCPVTRVEEVRERELPPAVSLQGGVRRVGGGKRRRRSSPLKAKKVVFAMSPIPELGE